MREDEAYGIETRIIVFFIAIIILFVIEMLSGCAVYPEPEPEVWQPRHSGTYQECDTVVNGVTYYYFKKI